MFIIELWGGAMNAHGVLFKTEKLTHVFRLTQVLPYRSTFDLKRLN